MPFSSSLNVLINKFSGSRDSPSNMCVSILMRWLNSALPRAKKIVLSTNFALNQTRPSSRAAPAFVRSPRYAAMTAVFIRLAPVASRIVNYTQILGLTGVDYGAAVILAAELINSLAVDFRTGVRWCVHFAVSCQTPSRVSTERRPLRIESSFAVVKPPKSGPAASSLHHTSPHPPSLPR